MMNVYRIQFRDSDNQKRVSEVAASHRDEALDVLREEYGLPAQGEGNPFPYVQKLEYMVDGGPREITTQVVEEKLEVTPSLKPRYGVVDLNTGEQVQIVRLIGRLDTGENFEAIYVDGELLLGGEDVNVGRLIRRITAVNEAETWVNEWRPVTLKEFKMMQEKAIELSKKRVSK